MCLTVQPSRNSITFHEKCNIQVLTSLPPSLLTKTRLNLHMNVYPSPALRQLSNLPLKVFSSRLFFALRLTLKTLFPLHINVFHNSLEGNYTNEFVCY